MLFERSVRHREQAGDSDVCPACPDIVVFEIGRYGGELIRGLKEQGWRVLGIDFDPDVISVWRKEELPVRYGDAEDPEFLAAIPLQGVSWIIRTAHERSVNLALLGALRHLETAVRVNWPEDGEALIKSGADLILAPFADGAKRAVEELVTFRQ